ncbi:putative small lipoprotein YifL [Povalibacter uvarum]|uniref:Putative small lipoprotein YifL n=1 Tax=Povalibacter uvarum TaxID=732238 RepID=A0A841HN39_9GAMM|nr:hypothetical protein [Povalibacter uvarum]MBB6094286.1 putative small lipoprotein YifL [Povalibacter uvarum]
MKAIAALLLALSLIACGGKSPPPTPQASAAATTGDTDALPADGAFIGKVWIATTSGHALGEMLVFLPDRSLLMDSCFETYRISGWGVAGTNIRWLEDSIPIEASVSLPSAEELSLHIIGQERAKTYVSASVPYVCPDMPK